MKAFNICWKSLDSRHSRCSVFLGVPFRCTLKALAGFSDVAQLREVNLANLLLSVRSLSKPAILGEVRYGLRKCLNGNYRD